MTDLLAWAVSSSVLILVVFAVRALGKNRLSCRARYALWLLALVRLLVPVQLFTASWGMSVPPLPERVTEKQFIPQIRQDAERTGLLTVIAPNLEGEPAGTALPDTTLPGAPLPGAAPGAEEARPDALPAYQWSVVDVLRAVYFGGAGILALVLLVSNLRFARRLRRARVPYDALCGGMRVYVAEGLTSPCLVGVLRPSVYLTPEATRDERTLRHVLAHETTHRIHGDCVWSLLRLAALCLHWYNPLAWLAAVASKRDGELACDERTLARLGEDERTAYGETLLTLVRAKPDARGLLSASTAMTAGKKPMRERIETIARHPRTKVAALLLALAVLLTATAVAFSRGAAKKADAPPEPGVTDEPVDAPSETRDAYASVEDYLEHVRASADTVTYYTWGPDGSAPEPYEAVAKVLDVRIDNLEKHGELSGLAPEGTLELYSCSMMYKTDVPAEEVLLIGGMYADGEYVAFANAGRTLVTLRYPNGNVEVLLDETSYDNMGGVWYYHNNAEEALHDWYVKENGLDLPLYTTDLLPDDELGNHPAHRVNGNGWYFYLPVSAWYRADDGEVMRWYSKYNTGSAITVTYLHETIVDAAERYQSWDWTLTPGSVPRVEHTSGANGNVHTTIRFYDDVHDPKKSGCWQVLTQYDTDALTDYPYIAQEPELLSAMARSFTVDTRLKAPAPTNLADFVKRLNDEQPVVTLRLIDGESGEARGPYDSRMLPNDPGARYILERCAFTPTDSIPVETSGRDIVTLEALGCHMTFYGDNYVMFEPGDGTVSRFVEERYDDLLSVARMWYDEAELNGLGGGYNAQDRIVIPDRGQTYLEAAQEHCDRLLGVSLRVSPGSPFRYDWMRCAVEGAEEQTALFRDNGELGENQWAFRLTELYVPENESAYHYGMAGNTLDYDEYIRDYAPEDYDPSVPEGACICWRVGYVTKEADGYHVELVGTGW